MANLKSPAELPGHIQQLLDDRDGHTAAIEKIDATLSRITMALGVGHAAPEAPVVKPTPVRSPAPKPKTAPRVAAKGGQTAAEFVLGLVKAKKDPTSQEVNQAWKAAGRNWTADITLSLLTKAKKLKRTPLGAGIRGSRYTIVG